ncbi:hypothetical protein [Blastopirellula marina]|uniref:Uncharacterized protein n=1 Tax=Blastopirellula marina TaxID=124 RepID=A0A2S8GP37_9BACT|nr:hypothetical protein [Blastopirellula marina]PQO46188.1 hypothetical protein C5Y93_09375 [Blastopirellula marina]
MLRWKRALIIKRHLGNWVPFFCVLLSAMGTLMTSCFLIANGLAVAADALVMLFALFFIALIVLVGLVCMFARIVPLLHLHCLVVALFAITFQPWIYWTGPPIDPRITPEVESAESVLAFIACGSICVMFFSILTVGVTVYSAYMHHVRFSVD